MSFIELFHSALRFNNRRKTMNRFPRLVVRSQNERTHS